MRLVIKISITALFLLSFFLIIIGLRNVTKDESIKDEGVSRLQSETEKESGDLSKYFIGKTDTSLGVRDAVDDNGDQVLVSTCELYNQIVDEGVVINGTTCGPNE